MSDQEKLMRSEILFLYDVKDNNPNGDLDDNKPRIDSETNINIVTDVRLKRTVREYLRDYEKDEGRKIYYLEEYWTKETIKKLNKGKDGKELKDDELKELEKKLEKKLMIAEERYKSIMDNNIKDNDSESMFCNKCIDVRLFGAMIPLGEDSRSIQIIGPVQFKTGRSLHPVQAVEIRGSGAFASKSGTSVQKTFRTEYVLPYSLICFYGIVNEKSAIKTGLTNEDVNLLLRAIWNGTKNLITRSKVGQVPRVLMQIEYSTDNFFIGDLDRKIKGVYREEDALKIRDISEIPLDLTDLQKELEKYKEKIATIKYKVDSRVKVMMNGKESEFEKLLEDKKKMIKIEF